MTDVRTVQAGGIQLAYREWAPASAPPLLLLHALGENSAARQVHLGRDRVSGR